MSDLNGRDFVANEDLYNKLGELVAAKGETCENILPSSLPWLLKNNHIGLVPTASLVADEAADDTPAAEAVEAAQATSDNPPSRRGRRGK